MEHGEFGTSSWYGDGLVEWSKKMVSWDFSYKMWSVLNGETKILLK